MFILSSLEVNGQLTLGQWRRYTALEGTSVSEAMRDSAIAMREGYRIWICQVVCCRIYRPNACAPKTSSFLITRCATRKRSPYSERVDLVVL